MKAIIYYFRKSPNDRGMALIQIANQSTKNLSKKSTIRFTQSICPDCNMILDAEVFERDDRVFMTKTCPTHGECEELYFGSYGLYKKFSTYWPIF